MKIRNPQMFQTFQSLRQNQNNPKEIFAQMTSKYTPEQMQQFKQFANGFGITNEQIDQFIGKPN